MQVFPWVLRALGLPAEHSSELVQQGHLTILRKSNYLMQLSIEGHGKQVTMVTSTDNLKGREMVRNVQV